MKVEDICAGINAMKVDVINTDVVDVAYGNLVELVSKINQLENELENKNKLVSSLKTTINHQRENTRLLESLISCKCPKHKSLDKYI